MSAQLTDGGIKMSSETFTTRVIGSLAVVLVFAFAVVAQEQEVRVSEKQVPGAVLSSFKSAYPNAKILGYSREKEKGKTYYEVESSEGEITRDVLYNPDGTVAEVEESIAVSELPAAVQEALKRNHPGLVITSVEKITRGDVTAYEAHGKQGRKRLELKFDPNGNPIKE
jgi:Putative beta-lactamase-inhibitor-like, PepSY-like